MTNVQTWHSTAWSELVLVFATALACLLSECGSAKAAVDCLGPLLTHIQIEPGIDFETNSRLLDAGGYRLFQDCAINRDKNNPVRIDWYATSLHGRWLPVGSLAIQMPRIPTVEPDKAIPTKSCIEYGLVGKTTETLLLGTNEDVAGDVSHPGCAAAANKPTLMKRVLEKLAPLVYQFFVAVPSDPRSPEKSLVTVAASITLKPRNDRSYDFYMDYELRRIQENARLGQLRLRTGSQSDPDARPVSEQIQEAFPSAGRQLAPDASDQTSDEKNSILVVVTGNEQWHLVPIHFEFINSDRELLSGIDLPLLSPAR